MVALLSACTETHGGPKTGPAVGRIPIAWSGEPSRRMRLDSWPLGIDADGKARWVVRVRFVDAEGHATKLLHAGDIEFHASRGDAQWQTRSRYDGPAAIISTTQSGPLAVRVVSKDPVGIKDAHAESDTRT